jgi:hypothetical protein
MIWNCAKPISLLQHFCIVCVQLDGRIILGWIFKKWDVGVRTGLGWLRIGAGGGHL